MSYTLKLSSSWMRGFLMNEATLFPPNSSIFGVILKRFFLKLATFRPKAKLEIRNSF